MAREDGKVTRLLVDDYDVLLLDLDGVVYAGAAALPRVPERLEAGMARGPSVMFVTNNAARTPETVAEHLTSLGIAADVDAVVTSAQAAADLVAELVPAGEPVLVVGGEGLVRAVEEHSLKPVSSAGAQPRAVVQGFHPDVDWTLLAEGAYAVAAGVPWVASNADLTIPTGRGIAPGNGALIEVIRIATGRTPRAVGKPEPTLFRTALRRSGRGRPLVVGDRLDTDIAGAVASGYPSLLVLTGIATLADALTATPDQRPTYIGSDLGTLLEAHGDPSIEDGSSSGEVRVTCGPWRAVLESSGGTTRLEPVRGDTPETIHDGFRALAVAVWTAHDAGYRTEISTALAAVEAAGWSVGDDARQ